ncbi:MAG: serine/threonine protein phosphatase [Acidilobaceae archaeon]|nr:serine/threonine protein phosphatase [Acidilobaceae archaeon]
MRAARLLEILLEMREEMEREERRTSYLEGERRGGVIRTRARGTVAIVGDIHGDLETMRIILREAERKADSLVLLGDYIDRGPPEGQVGVLEELYSLKMTMGERAVILRGNHEPGFGIASSPHDFPMALRLLFGETWRELYDASVKLFEAMPHALILEGGLLALHGGPPVEPAPDPFTYLASGRERGRLVEILFNDPTEAPVEAAPSPRGAGFVWGAAVTRRALNIVGAQLIVRGHEAPPEGFKFNHGKKVVTLFSRLGLPYLNSRAAFMLCAPEDISSPESCIITVTR